MDMRINALGFIHNHIRSNTMDFLPFLFLLGGHSKITRASWGVPQDNAVVTGVNNATTVQSVTNQRSDAAQGKQAEPDEQTES